MSDDIFTAGDLIIITSGEYSSYGVNRIVRALKDFTLDDIKNTPGCTEDVPYERHKRILTGEIIAAGFVEELPDHREIWLGSC